MEMALGLAVGTGPVDLDCQVHMLLIVHLTSCQKGQFMLKYCWIIQTWRRRGEWHLARFGRCDREMHWLVVFILCRTSSEDNIGREFIWRDVSAEQAATHRKIRILAVNLARRITGSSLVHSYHQTGEYTTQHY